MRLDSPFWNQDVRGGGFGSLAPKRACSLYSRGEPGPRVRPSTAAERARSARAGEAVPPGGALVRETECREPPLGRSGGGTEPRPVSGEAA
ncbi:hypothetical protein NDU88_007423 [Pleurodeles waltl]|uniref:Uncharacterized protein n=1 Tax=Pleurodeles waltl TaxID=8319 RepID=A0AAV7RRS0_PLEWA|nr:hypothetical protein NDU88_007417 [Pleurodeles waltl]KAJ1154680.1 hypothetical protein NDU88_007423 [Pleurodeles waltl]